MSTPNGPYQPQYPPPPYPGYPPRRRRPWSRNRKGWTIVGGVFAGLIAVGGISQATGHNPKAPVAAPAPTVTVTVTKTATVKPTAKASAAAAVASIKPKPKPSATEEAAVAPKTACKDLLAWENSGATGSVADDAALKRIFARTTPPLSHDYAAWIAAPLDRAYPIGSRIGNECQAYGISVFTPTGDGGPSPTPAPSADTVTYVVTGSYAQVSYGPAGSSDSGSVPMDVTQPLGSPLYYAINAQLQGGGSVSCEIEVDGQVVSQSSASGGYNIAQCEISQDPLTGGWQDTNGG